MVLMEEILHELTWTIALFLGLGFVHTVYYTGSILVYHCISIFALRRISSINSTTEESHASHFAFQKALHFQ